MDSAPFYYGRQNAQHIAAASIHSYYEYIKNSEELQWGDGFFLFRGPCFNTGSPPLARGILLGGMERTLLLRITPACAGNTALMPARLRNLQDHPRLRGEYEVTAKYPVTDVGSPPLARGILWPTDRDDH